MGKTKQSFGVALTLALLLVFAAPAWPQDQDTQAAPDQDQTEAPSSEVQTAPEETKNPPAVHHAAKKKKPVHHKHAKKKKVHKTPPKKHHAKKPVKKAHAPVHHPKKPVKKAAPKPKEVKAEPLAPVKTETASKPVPLAPVKEAKEKPAKAIAAPAMSKDKTAATGAGKTVTYTFCLGYDNCVPYRYEAIMKSGAVNAKVFKEAGDRDWAETKIDPVMASDLSTMARSETGSDVARPLTVTEKARIADHQGKVHVDLVSAANDGNKAQVKQMLTDLGIKNENELATYDDRLAKNDTAVSAAKELGAGR